MDNFSNNPEFWTKRYNDGETRWDLGSPSYGLQYIIKLGILDEYQTIFVPGSGNGHDALELAKNGFSVTACDFAEPPIRNLRAQAEKDNINITLWHRDLFELIDQPKGIFDACFEYTCFCAIPPARRHDYKNVISHLIKPGGLLLWFVFPIDKDNLKLSGPTPYELNLNEIKDIFLSQWEWLFDFPSHAAPPLRRGHERILLMRRK